MDRLEITDMVLTDEFPFKSLIAPSISAEQLELLELAYRACRAGFVAAQLETDWSLTQGHLGQHVGDISADTACVSELAKAGISILTEESGVMLKSGELIAVVDPVDGSTNAARGLPLWCSSVSIADQMGPLVSVVITQPEPAMFWAVRGAGSYRDGQRLNARSERSLDTSIVFLNGYCDKHLGWAQYRALGSAALEVCLVGSGNADAFVDCSVSGLGCWDYFGAILIASEAGCTVAERDGHDLLEANFDQRRHLLIARSPAMMDQLLGALSGKD